MKKEFWERKIYSCICGRIYNSNALDYWSEKREGEK